MDDGVKLVELTGENTLCIRTRASMETLPMTIGGCYSRILEYLEILGEECAGIPYVAYYNLDMTNMDVEIGFPVAKPLPASGDIKPGHGASGLCVEAMYKGPYSAMVMTYNYVAEWMHEHGYENAGPYYEYYYNSPMEVPESELLTKIVIPVRKKV